MRVRFWRVFLVVTLVVGSAVFFLFLAGPGGFVPVWKKEVVRPATVVIIERRYLCGERDLLSEGPAPRALVGLDAEGLRRFSEKSGCELEHHLPAAVRLTYKVVDFCPHHRLYRHIGIKGNYVAVFEGPLGFDHRLLRCERSLPEGSLTPGLRKKLFQGMNFAAQPAAVQAQLRRELEFPNEAELNAVLENLDELQE